MTINGNLVKIILSPNILSLYIKKFANYLQGKND